MTPDASGSVDAQSPADVSPDHARDDTPVVPTNTCETAPEIAANEVLSDQHTITDGTHNDVCRPSDAPQRFYTFVLPEHQRATITVTPRSTFRAVVRVFQSCSGTSCLTDDESAGPGDVVQLHVDSPGNVAVRKYVSVSGVDAASGGIFDIALHIEPIATSSCPGIGPVVRELALPHDAARGMPLDTTGPITVAPCPDGNGTTDVYTLRVDHATGVSIRVERSPSDFVSVGLRRACDRSTEIACEFNHSINLGAAQLRRVLDPGVYYLMIATHDDGASPGFRGGYALTVDSFDPASNLACGTALPIADGTRLPDQDPRRGGQPVQQCNDNSGPLEAYPPLYYAATVPAHQSLAVNAAPAIDTAAIGVRIGGCSTGSCAGGPYPHRGLFVNTGDSAVDVLAVLSGNAPADLDAHIGSPPSNAVCTSARPVTDGTRLLGESAVLVPATTFACASSTAFVYYAVSIPSGATLTARATPHGPTSVVVATGDCASPTCDAYRIGEPGAASTVTYTNEGSSAIARVLAVGYANDAVFEPFDLDVAIR